jgi:hypothetical protein
MSTPFYAGSGGWLAGTKRYKVSIGPDLSWLASQRYTTKRGGVTLKQAVPSASAINEVQSLATSTATGGTFKLSFKGETTTALAFSATAATIQTALRLLSTIAPVGVTVTGGAANAAPVVFTFGGTLAGQDVPLIEFDGALLTGGTSTGVTVTTKGSVAGVSEVLQGTFVIPDTANPGYYKVALTGDTIDDFANSISGFTMASVNIADGDVTVGLLVSGSVLKARVYPYPMFTNVKNACAGRIVFQ